MKAYLTEFIGTFFLVLTIGLTVTAGTPLAPVAIGSILMVMVYMGGHISGAHYNPAVTLAVFLRGKIAAAQVVPYMLAQFAASIVAALTVWYLTGKHFPCEKGANVNDVQALLVEFLFTFALALVVVNVATVAKTAGNSYFGLAIGMTVLAGAYAGGPISGGAFNPAVGVGPILVHKINGGGSWAHLWLYLVGPFAGGLAAAMVFQVQNSD